MKNKFWNLLIKLFNRNKKMTHKITDEIVYKIKQMHRDGITHRKMKMIFGMSYTTLSRITFG